MQRAAIVILLSAGGLGLLGGCAPQLDRIESAVQQNQAEIADMQAQNRRVQQEVGSLADMLRLEMNAGDETNAQRFAKLNQVSNQLDQLMQKLDDNAAYMRDLSARVDLLATRAGVPTLGEYKAPEAGSRAGLAALPEEGRSIFDAAMLDRSRGNVEPAREGFQEFLTRYGRSELADDARYWLGDLAYGQGDFAAAATEFSQLLSDFPQTDKAPAALLKRGYCLRELGKTDEATAVFNDLISRYPDSNEAGLAKDEIANQ